jgi:hypothetical protein
MFSTVDLLVKIACFVKKNKTFQYLKELVHFLVREVNCTKHSPSVGVSWFNSFGAIVFYDKKNSGGLEP